MTPAKLLVLDELYMEDVATETFPVDKLSWIYANSQRDPGEKDGDGKVIHPPAKAYDIDDFRTYGRKLKSLVTKDSVWDYSLYGAQASEVAFKAWAGVKVGEEFIPHKEN